MKTSMYWLHDRAVWCNDRDDDAGLICCLVAVQPLVRGVDVPPRTYPWYGHVDLAASARLLASMTCLGLLGRVKYWLRHVRIMLDEMR